MNTITKVSDITFTDIAEYLRLTEDLIEDESNVNFITSTIGIAKAFISNYTGIAEADLDNYGDFPIVKKVENISTNHVEAELHKLGINPLRWAITNIENTTLTVSLAYERK